MGSERPVSHDDPAYEHAPVSKILRALADGHSGETISVSQIMQAFGERGFGLLLILFSLPNLIPTPGLGEIFGVPLLLLGLQMLWGRPQPWLPDTIKRRSIRHAVLLRIVGAIEPRLRRVEAILRPRLTFMFSPAMDRAFGGYMVLCSLPIMIPFPGTNFPVALATILMALAIMEEDGIVLIFGALIALAGLTYTVIFVGAFAWMAGASLLKLVGG